MWLLDAELNILSYETMLDSINTLAWSPDGIQLAMVGQVDYACQLQIWDATLTEQTFSLDVCSDDIKWNQDGTRLAVVEIDPGLVRLVDTVENNLVANLLGSRAVWSDDGTQLITSTSYTPQNFDLKNGIYVWEGTTGDPVSSLEDMGFPPQFLWTVDENLLAIRCDETTEDVVYNNICTYNPFTGEQTLLFEFYHYNTGQGFSLRDLTFNPDQNSMIHIHDKISRGFLDVLYVLDIELGIRSRLTDAEHYTVSPNGVVITAVAGNGFIRNVSIETGDILSEFALFTAPINSLDWRPDSNDIATAGYGYGQHVRVWDGEVDELSPQLIWDIEVGEFINYVPDGSAIITDGSIRLDAATNHYSTISWNAYTGRQNDVITDEVGLLPFREWNADYTRYIYLEGDAIRMSDDADVAIPIPDLFLDAFLSPDETMLAVVHRQSPQDYAYIINVWDLTTNEQINQIVGTMNAFRDLHWSPDSSMLMENIGRMTGGGWNHQFLRAYLIEKDRNYSFDNNEFEVYGGYDYLDSGAPYPLNMAWRSDNAMIAVTFNDLVAVYEFGNEEPLLTIPIRDMAQIVWSSDNTQIAFGGYDGVVYVVDVSDFVEDAQ